MVLVRYARGALAVAFSSSFLALCQCGTSTDAASTTAGAAALGPSGTATAALSATQSASAAQDRAPDDDVKPVYPQTAEAPDPTAQKYCDLVYEAAESKRKECCPSTPFTSFRPTGECARTLSHALRSGAVVLAKGALDACEAAVLAAAKQCDWGGEVPAACDGILVGQVAEQGVCRSSLECKEGTHCAGLGVASPGKCVRPKPDGARCSAAVDSLGAFVHQDTERKHPQCEGFCERHKCSPVLAVGAKCLSSLQCGADRTCLADKCSDAPLPAAGKPCAGGRCAKGNRCIEGACVTEKRIGEECASDLECRSQLCEKASNEKGKCAMSCQIMKPTPQVGWTPPAGKKP